jgi:hypothetical protein
MLNMPLENNHNKALSAPKNVRAAITANKYIKNALNKSTTHQLRSYQKLPLVYQNLSQ